MANFEDCNLVIDMEELFEKDNFTKVVFGMLINPGTMLGFFFQSWVQAGSSELKFLD